MDGMINFFLAGFSFAWGTHSNLFLIFLLLGIINLILGVIFEFKEAEI